MVSSGVSRGFSTGVSSVASRSLLATAALFDKVGLKSGFADRSEINIGLRRFGVQPRSAHAYLIHLGARHLIQCTGDTLHASPAVHAVDLKKQLGHIPPPPIRIGCGILPPDATSVFFAGRQFGLEAIADAADGPEKYRICRVVFDVTAQAHDEVVDRARIGV